MPLEHQRHTANPICDELEDVARALGRIETRVRTAVQLLERCHGQTVQDDVYLGLALADLKALCAEN